MYERYYRNLFHFFESRSKVFHATLSVLLGSGIGYLDYLTSDIDFVLFYIVPIFLTTWFVGKNAGRAASVLSCITSFGVNMDTALAKSTVKHLAWDFTLDMLFFIFLGFMFRMLREKYDEVNNLALRDPLTQALNRRSLTELAEYELLASRRHRRPFSIAFIDLDNFKTVNDQLGHNVGDRLLLRIVDVMRSTVRSTDLVARMGGDEFVVALPETGTEQARKVFDKLRAALLESMAAEDWPVTFSIGAVTCEWPACSLDAILNRADTLMYQVKSMGKNSIIHDVVGEQHSADSPDVTPSED